MITLPAGSTPVDFAYAVHTEVGHRCIGARVNGRLVALERKLENGEVVEVFTSKAPTPARRATGRLRGVAAGEGQDPAVVRQGRREEAVEAARSPSPGGPPRRTSVAALVNGDAMSALAHELRYADVSRVYTAVGEGHVSPATWCSGWSG